MPQNSTSEIDTQDREIVLTRVFQAPRERVWQAWTDPKELIEWWGPQGFTNTFQEIDIRPGGVWRFIMHGPDGTDYPNLIVFDEVLPPERLTYSHGSGQENDPDEFQVIVTFAEAGADTKLTMRLIMSSAAVKEKMITEVGAIESGNQTLDRLAAQLAKR